MGFIDKFGHPKFEPNDAYTFEEHPTKKDIPYRLEHVYDLNSKQYVTDNKMCCYYSPSHHHETCKHKRDCLWKRQSIWASYMEFQKDSEHVELHDLIDSIWIVTNRIKELKEVINDYVNGNITYHSFIDDCYIVQINCIDGHLVADMSVESNFKSRVRTAIKQSEMELRDLKRELFHRRRNL